MRVIDADTHVIESTSTWKFFDTRIEQRRPYLVAVAGDQGNLARHRWIIDGKLVPKPEGRGAEFLATPPIEGLQTGDADDVRWAWRSFEDPLGRVDDAKRRGIDLQVVYPTLFIAFLTGDVALEVALAQSYNRFMADTWHAVDRRFNWIVVPALRDLEVSLAEMRFGRENGAVGVLFRGIEGDRSLGDPYFDPIYAEAADLDMPICIHTGPGCPTLTEMSDSRYMRNFGHVRLLPVIGIHDLIFSRVPERHPGLRFGSIEAAASWVPYLLHFLRRGSRRAGPDPSFFGPEMFERYRIFIACEADEDIPYLAEAIGWDHLLIGTDYGHTDQSAELDIVAKIKARTDIDDVHAEMLLSTNPSTFYGLS